MAENLRLKAYQEATRNLAKKYPTLYKKCWADAKRTRQPDEPDYAYKNRAKARFVELMKEEHTALRLKYAEEYGLPPDRRKSYESLEDKLARQGASKVKKYLYREAMDHGLSHLARKYRTEYRSIVQEAYATMTKSTKAAKYYAAKMYLRDKYRAEYYKAYSEYLNTRLAELEEAIQKRKRQGV